jgi:hypothetical protein
MSKLQIRIVLCILVFCTLINNAYAASYGSDSAVALVPAPAITGPDNIINTFAHMHQGFAYTDASTTCSFKSIFPVTGDINLNGGTLYLMNDLVMNNPATFIDFGKIKAQQHIINFSENFKSFASPGSPTGTHRVLELISRVTALTEINSADWSYDEKYVAISTNNAANDIQIYSFDGKTLTLAASYNYGNSDGFAIKWHPSSYFFAAISSRTTNKINLFQFTPSGTITLLNTQNPTGTFYSVAWNGTGTHIAAGGTTLTTYRFNTTSNILDTQITPTNTATLNGNILTQGLKWAPRGSQMDLIAVTNNAGTNGSMHLYNFTGAALNHRATYPLGIAANTMDWAKTCTYVAVGFANNTIKTYQHDALLNNITYKNNYTEQSAIRSVSWTIDGTELAAGLAYTASNIEFDFLDFNESTYALSSKYTLDSTSNVNVVSFDHASSTYMLRADATTNYLSVYKSIYSPYELKDAKLFLNSDLVLSSPLTFTGACTIDGRNHTITFSADGALHLAKDSSLDIQLATLRFINPTGIVLQGPTSDIRFKNGIIQLDSDITWGDGKFEVYNDLIITGPHTFNYQTNYTSTIHSFSQLNIHNGAELKLGKTKASTIEPLSFSDNTAILNLNNATLHTTGSGLTIIKGSVHSYGNSTINIDWTQSNSNDTTITATNQGLIFGDGRNEMNDALLSLHEGSLDINGGGIVFNPAQTTDMIHFYGQALLSFNPTTTMYFKQSILMNNGNVRRDPATTLHIDPSAILTMQNTKCSAPLSTFDYNLTGTISNVSAATLDQDDTLIINNGVFDKAVSIVQSGNLITGNGTLTGVIIFKDNTSQLSWNLTSAISSTSDIYLNGGQITLLQNTELYDGITFKNTGIIDLNTHTFGLGGDPTQWTDDLYWTGNNAVLKLNNNIVLDGVWTLSGDIIIDGNDYILELGTTGSIILEHGAHVTFKNVSLKNLSRTNRITCSDNNCQITLNQTGILLNDNYVFETGSIYAARDSYIGLIDGLDTMVTFSYESTQTSTIDTFCKFTISDGIRFSIGRKNSEYTHPQMQPLVFANPITSRLILDGGTLHITSSGMLLTQGTMKINNSSKIEIENLCYPYGLILGDGTQENDFALKIGPAVNLILKSGRLFYNNYFGNRLVFDSPESNFSIEQTQGLMLLKNLTLSKATVSTPYEILTPIGIHPSASFYVEDTHRYDYKHILDYYVTATIENMPGDVVPSVILASNGSITMNPGTFDRNIVIKESGNKVTGIGNVSGTLIFMDNNATLTWDTPQKYIGRNIALNGGKIIYTQDSGIGPQYSFIGTGTIDLTNKTFQLGSANTTWPANINWMGNGATMILNNNIIIDGTWTLSGNITIEGNNYLIDLAPTGSLILERGAQVRLRNTQIHNLSQQNKITCNDDSSKIILNNATLVLSGDYAFDKGSIFVYHNSAITAGSGLDANLTFSYDSTQTSSIGVDSYLEINPRITLAIGRHDATNTDPTQQPFVFADASSALNLNGGSLHITSSGMILTKGILQVTNTSDIQIDSSQYERGLILGDGSTENDYSVCIKPGVQLKIIEGRLFYQNAENNRICFDSPASSIDIQSDGGFTAKTDLIVKDGSLYTTGTTNIAITKDAGITTIQDNITRIYKSPYSIQKRKVHALRPYVLENEDFYYVTEGYTTNDVIARSGTTAFGGTGAFMGTLTLHNPSTTLQCSLETPLFCNPILNGGTFALNSNLAFAADKSFTGSGNINLNGTSVIFGAAKDLTLTHTIYWRGITNGGITLNAQTTNLSGEWTVGGNININGNGNVLDISHQGQLNIKPHATMALDNIAIKGLGEGFGSINFMDDTATLKLSNAYIELDNNVTTTIGGIIVNGPTTVGIKNFDWLLDQSASMTIDGVTLWQDSLDQVYHGNITHGTGPLSKYLTLESTGTIKTISSVPCQLEMQIKNNSNALNRINKQSQMIFGPESLVVTPTFVMTADIYLSNDHRMLMTSDTYDYVINGSGHTIYFADGTAHQIQVASGAELTLYNVILKNYRDDTILADNIVFGDGTRIELANDQAMARDWNLEGNTTIDGAGYQLTIDPYALRIQPNSTLWLQSIALTGLKNDNINCTDATSAVVFENTNIHLTHNTTFTRGIFEALQDVHITGTNELTFASDQNFIINSSSHMLFDGIVFSYAPETTDNRDLVQLADKSSTLQLDGCTVNSTTTGMRLTRGQVIINHINTFNNPGATSLSEGFGFGNGIADDDLDILIKPGASLNLASGMLDYANVQ